MDRILAMALVGAGPGHVFGPGMSAGALESFANSRGGGGGGAAAGGGTRSAGTASGSGGRKCGADQRTAEKEANGAGGQEARGAGAAAGANETRCCPPAVDWMVYFDAAVAPY